MKSHGREARSTISSWHMSEQLVKHQEQEQSSADPSVCFTVTEFMRRFNVIYNQRDSTSRRRLWGLTEEQSLNFRVLTFSPETAALLRWRTGREHSLEQRAVSIVGVLSRGRCVRVHVGVGAKPNMHINPCTPSGNEVLFVVISEQVGHE